jgi:hypothetical protein
MQSGDFENVDLLQLETVKRSRSKRNRRKAHFRKSGANHRFDILQFTARLECQKSRAEELADHHTLSFPLNKTHLEVAIHLAANRHAAIHHADKDSDHDLNPFNTTTRGSGRNPLA